MADRKKCVIANLLPSAVRGAVTDSASASEKVGEQFADMAAYLAVTAVTGTSPNLTLFVDESIDNGTTWHQVAAFTAATGATTEKEAIARPIGRMHRFRHTITGSATPTVTFAAWLLFEREGPS